MAIVEVALISVNFPIFFRIMTFWDTSSLQAHQ